MSRILGWLSWLVTARPYVTLLVLLLITVLLGAGAVQRAAPPTTEETLPKDSPVTKALAEIDEVFGESGEANVVTLIFRGEALTPEGLTQMDALLGSIPATQVWGSCWRQSIRSSRLRRWSWPYYN